MNESMCVNYFLHDLNANKIALIFRFQSVCMRVHNSGAFFDFFLLYGIEKRAQNRCVDMRIDTIRTYTNVCEPFKFVIYFIFFSVIFIFFFPGHSISHFAFLYLPVLCVFSVGGATENATLKIYVIDFAIHAVFETVELNHHHDVDGTCCCWIFVTFLCLFVPK